MVYKSGQIFPPFCHNPRVWRTDGQTDRQTDGQTDRILLAIPRLHYMQRGKNDWYDTQTLTSVSSLSTTPNSVIKEGYFSLLHVSNKYTNYLHHV